VSGIATKSSAGSVSKGDVLISLKILEDRGMFLRDFRESLAERLTCFTNLSLWLSIERSSPGTLFIEETSDWRRLKSVNSLISLSWTDGRVGVAMVESTK